MRIAIDLTAVLPDATGVDNYLISLVTHLGRVDRQHDYTLFVNVEDRDFFAALVPKNFSIVAVCRRPRPARLLFQQVLLPVMARVRQIDVVHSPAFLMPMYRGSQRHVLTVYDLSFITHPECHIALRRSGSYRWALLQSIRRTHLVTVPSAFTQQQILELVPGVPRDRVHIVPAGINDDFRPQPQPLYDNGTRPPWSSNYILFVGTIEPRKNLERLIESYRRLVSGSQVSEHLVLAGRLGWDYERLLRMLSAPELTDRVHLTGYVSHEELLKLYAGARLFVYPSIEEGFGFPPLEAMACGIPTMSSSSSSLLENLQGAAHLVDPFDTDALSSAMLQLLRDERCRTVLAQKGIERASRFRWDRTARQTIACYEEALRA